jgi:cardiolipin synthase
MTQEIFEKIYFYLLVWDKWVIPPFWLILQVVGIAAGIHALMHKRDPRSALGWTAVCWMIPGIGTVFYLLFGVNRIQTRAQDWQDRGHWNYSRLTPARSGEVDAKTHVPPFDRAPFLALSRLSQSVTELPLLRGNQVKPLFNGEQAYPAMLAAIRQAQRWIFLGTYIFETNGAGMEFLQALQDSVGRGLEVRVLVDGVGTRYSKPPIQKLLKNFQIPFALFLPLTFSPRGIHMNLRTHRKILVVDGEVGFTGGMNIGDRHLVELANNPRPTQDIHFQLNGPIVEQLKEAFLLDWHFARKEMRQGNFSCDAGFKGEALARGIIAGPNEDFEKLKWIVEGAIHAAKTKIRIMTPYFIPDRAMVSALITAALRGVEIEIILPEANNLAYVKWASQALIEEILDLGIKVFYQPGPFAHSKLFLVDDFYSLIGSANLDPRSLRLNFEFNVEVYDTGLNSELTRHFASVLSRSRPITSEYLEGRNFFVQLRDDTAKLFSPYL